MNYITQSLDRRKLLMKKSIVIHLFLCIIASVYLPVIHIADQYAVHEYQFTYLYFIKIIAAIVFGGMFCMDQQCSVRSLGDLILFMCSFIVGIVEWNMLHEIPIYNILLCTYLGGSVMINRRKKVNMKKL